MSSSSSESHTILLDWAGQSYHIAPAELTMHTPEVNRPLWYRIRDWRLKILEQLGVRFPGLAKGSFPQRLEFASKALLQRIKLSQDTLGDWQRNGHQPPWEIQELAQKLDYYETLLTQNAKGTQQRKYVCWGVVLPKSIEAFCVILDIENSWTGPIPKLLSSSAPSLASSSSPAATPSPFASTNKRSPIE